MKSQLARQSGLSSTADRIKNILGIAVGLFLGTAGVLKLSNFTPFARAYAEAAQPLWVFYGSGVIEVVAGVALMLPRFRIYAAWSLLAMIFLVTWKPWLEHDSFFLISQIAAIGLLIFLVWRRPSPSVDRRT